MLKCGRLQLTTAEPMRERLILIALNILFVSVSQGAERYVSLTIDDLPYQRGGSLADDQALTTKLVGHVRELRVPTVGFVNETKLHENGPEQLAARTALLKQWLDAGVELGNHTYSHVDINAVPFEDYTKDLLKGEEITRALMRERGMTLRYFRHPYLRAGKEAAVKADLEKFLREHEYVIAPVTIDNDEWIFGGAYDVAAKRGDAAAMQRIGRDYLDYMEHAFVFSEHLARQVVGRDIKHVLLVHANAMNAEYLDDLIAEVQQRGYEFIALPKVLSDDAYRREDPYVGPKGWSWLLRWGVGQQLDTSAAPQVPGYVMELAGVE
jgi:peptidoglycan/xylan/chitin deacetylase (PgdA/CDA1 family)